MAMATPYHEYMDHAPQTHPTHPTHPLNKINPIKLGPDSDSRTVTEHVHLNNGQLNCLSKNESPKQNDQTIQELEEQGYDTEDSQQRFIDEIYEDCIEEEEIIDHATKSHLFHQNVASKPVKQDKSAISHSFIDTVHKVYNEVLVAHGKIWADKLKALLIKYRRCFGASKYDIGCVDGITFKLELKDGAVAENRERWYKLPLVHENEIYNTLGELIRHRIVEKVDSTMDTSWVNGVFCVVNPDKSSRMVTNFVKLNLITKDIQWTIPSTTDTLSKFHGTDCYSKMDVMKAFFNIPVHKDTLPLMNFITRHGVYRWLRMPFGPKQSPAIWNLFASMVFDGIGKQVVRHIDELIVCTKGKDEQLLYIEKVLQNLVKYKLKVKLSKCEWLKSDVIFLGHKIDKNGVVPDIEYIQKLLRFAPPQNRKELRSWIGAVEWISDYIWRIKGEFGIFRDLLSHNKGWNWTEKHEAAFHSIRSQLVNVHVHSHPDLTKEFIIFTDSSDLGYGGILLQRGGEHGYKLIDMYSHMWPAKDQHRHITTKEIMSVTLSINRWNHYLQPSQFIIYSDNYNVRHLFRRTTNKRDLNQLHYQLMLQLQSYNFTVVYIRSIHNYVADYLSRYSNEIDFKDVAMDRTMQSYGKERKFDFKEKRPKHEQINVDMDPPQYTEMDHNYYRNLRGEQLKYSRKHHSYWLYNERVNQQSASLDGKESKYMLFAMNTRLAKKRKMGSLNEDVLEAKAWLKSRSKSKSKPNKGNKAKHSKNRTSKGNPRKVNITHSLLKDINSNLLAESDAARAGDSTHSDPKIKKIKLKKYNHRERGQGVGRSQEPLNNDTEHKDDAKYGSNNDIESGSESESTDTPSDDDYENLALEIDQNVFNIEYEKAVMSQSGNLTNFDFDTIRTNQRSYVYYAIILRYMTGTDWKGEYISLPSQMYQDLCNDRYRLTKDEVLYYFEATNGIKRWCLAPVDQVKVMEYYHINGGHCNAKAMIAEIKANFYWTGIDRDCAEFVKYCECCQRVKLDPDTKVGRGSVLRPTYPGQVISIDHMGRFPMTSDGSVYITIYRDHFSGWSKAVTAPSIDKWTTTRNFKLHYIDQFGPPDRILSDLGSDFASDFMRDLCTVFGITKSSTTAYMPSSNGGVERFNRSFKMMLKLIFKDKDLSVLDGDDWHLVVSQICATYNNRPSIRSKFKMCPNQVFIGRKWSTYMDEKIGNKLVEKYKGTKMGTMIHNIMSISAKEMDKHLTRYQDSMERRLEASRKENPFKVGDIVIYRMGGHNVNKLKVDKYSEPMKIIKMNLSNNTVYLKPLESRPGDKSKVLQANISKLKKFRPQSTYPKLKREALKTRLFEDKLKHSNSYNRNDNSPDNIQNQNQHQNPQQQQNKNLTQATLPSPASKSLGQWRRRLPRLPVSDDENGSEIGGDQIDDAGDHENTDGDQNGDFRDEEDEKAEILNTGPGPVDTAGLDDAESIDLAPDLDEDDADLLIEDGSEKGEEVLNEHTYFNQDPEQNQNTEKQQQQNTGKQYQNTPNLRGGGFRLNNMDQDIVRHRAMHLGRLDW